MTDQYRDASNLNARIVLHARFSANAIGWYRWVFDHIEAPPSCALLDLGCGPGTFWRDNHDRIPPDWHVTLCDSSAGMVANAKRALAKAQDAVAPAEDLPFDNASFDVVLANHMLYHVSNLDRALAEIRRVLRPGGRLYATTNGANHLRELRKWAKRFRFTFFPSTPPTLHGFNLERGRHDLAEWFNHVHLERYDDELAVTEVEPLVAYLQSMAPDTECPKDELERCRAFFRHLIEQDGAIHITKDTGLFTAVVGSTAPCGRTAPGGQELAP